MTYGDAAFPIDDAAVAEEQPAATPFAASPVEADLGRRPRPAGAIHGRRSPWIATLLAGFPGLGSVYNGSYARGVAFFLTVFGLIYLAANGNEMFGFAIAFVWLFNMVDAYREARLIQFGLATDLGVERRRPSTSAEGLGLGATLVFIGLIAFLDSTLGLDVDWIFELWPIGMILAGAWFIVAAVRRMRSERPANADRTAL